MVWAEEARGAVPGTIGHAEIDGVLMDLDSPEAEAQWGATSEIAADLMEQLGSIEQKLLAISPSRLRCFEQVFDLSYAESDLFQTCLAIALDPSLKRGYAYLQDHAGRPHASEALAARLFGHGRCGPWSANSNLFFWQLLRRSQVSAGEPEMLSCDPYIVDWFLGRGGLDPRLASVACVRESLPPLENWPVDDVVDQIDRVWRSTPNSSVRVVVYGLHGSGRRSFAAAVAARLDFRLLEINADAVDDLKWKDVLLCAARQAKLDNFALAWYGESLSKRRWLEMVSKPSLQFLVAEPTCEIPGVADLVETRVDMPQLTVDDRLKLWRRFLPVVQTWQEEKLDELCRQRRASIGEIVDIARKWVTTFDEVSSCLRESSRKRLGRLAQLVECTFGWDDLVVPDLLREMLEDIVFEAREREAFWEKKAARELFPHGKGLIALFSGPPGTGKTMAAQIIAFELGIDLFRIDLSAVVSKYVGETSKNLDRILAKAQNAQVVLLFDEADALFGKRTEIHDAHDRFANTDTNYLLQAIEGYNGVALLATNKKENMDAAFIRRMRYAVEFRKPDASDRERIWKRLVGKLIGEDDANRLEADLEKLARQLELTGAEIKFGLLTSVFIARRDGKPLAMTHLLRGIDRELLKNGRSLTRREHERLLKNGGGDSKN